MCQFSGDVASTNESLYFHSCTKALKGREKHDLITTQSCLAFRLNKQLFVLASSKARSGVHSASEMIVTPVQRRCPWLLLCMLIVICFKDSDITKINITAGNIEELQKRKKCGKNPECNKIQRCVLSIKVPILLTQISLHNYIAFFLSFIFKPPPPKTYVNVSQIKRHLCQN